MLIVEMSSYLIANILLYVGNVSKILKVKNVAIVKGILKESKLSMLIGKRIEEKIKSGNNK